MKVKKWTEFEKKVAIVIFKSCENLAGSKRDLERVLGNASGNEWRWQDYLHVAKAVIKEFRKEVNKR